METMRRSHFYEQLPSTQYESQSYEYPRIDESQSLQRLLPQESLTLSEGSSLASGGAARGLNPHPVIRQVSGSTHCYQNTYRKRENPLYQSISHVDGRSSDSASGPCCSCFSVLSTVLAVVACILAFISIGIVFMKHDVPEAANQTYVKELEAKLDSINQKYDSLLQQVAAVTIKELPLLRVQHDELITNLTLSVKSQIFEQMYGFQLVINQTVSNISKLPGPPGPPGVGNLTECSYATKSTGRPSAMPETLTPWIPENLQKAVAFVITGVECSTRNGMGAFLIVSTEDGFTKYRCRCIGAEFASAESRYCDIHFWSCPLIS